MALYRSGYKHIVGMLGFFIAVGLFLQCTSESSSENQQDQAQQSAQHTEEDSPELADAMGQLQSYTHKYALALEAQNYELASFYFHEVEASADEIKKNIPGYEGYDIAELMSELLDPTLETAEESLEDRNWEEAREKTIEMVDTCNSCHVATDHGFIQITPGFDNNPFNQDFSAVKE